MATTIKRPFHTFNGTDWDTHYFDTSEDQIKSGWTQNLIKDGGYRKLPGGLILEFGVAMTPVNGDGNANINIAFPLAFPNEVFCVFTRQFLSGYYADVLNKNVWLVRYNNANFAITGNSLSASTNFETHWLALGR